MKASFKSSESFPRADMVKTSPYGSNKGSTACSRDSEKAEIPVLEVNAMAEKDSSDGLLLLGLG